MRVLNKFLNKKQWSLLRILGKDVFCRIIYLNKK